MEKIRKAYEGCGSKITYQDVQNCISEMELDMEVDEYQKEQIIEFLVSHTNISDYIMEDL